MSGVITQNIRINTNIESDHNASHVLITFSLIESTYKKCLREE